jgi:multidrug efflux pump subunit AcrA (membrane-fusion protein)
VERGSPVTFTLDGLSGQEFEGRVSAVTTERAGPLRGQRFRAIVEFRNDQGLVKPNMEANVAVRTRQARNVLAVPYDAVDRDASDRPVVQVLRNGNWQTEVVEVGLTGNQYTEIKSGLQEGETILVTPGLG